jgi:hypothetical protein
MAEAAEAIDDISRILAPFKPNYPEEPAPGSDPARAVAIALSPQQAASMAIGGLEVTALSPSQRSAIWNLAMWFYLNGACASVTDAGQHLSGLAMLEPVFRWDIVAAQDEFGADELTESLSSTEFTAISHPDTLVGYAKSPGGTRYPIRVSFGPPNSEQPPDPSDPGFAAPALYARELALSKVTVIADILRLLNARAGGRPKYTADRGLGEKCVSIAGVDSLQAAQILSGVADVYGLELRHKSDGSTNIARVRTASVVDVAEMPRALKAAVPKQINRCILARLGDIHALEMAGQPRRSPWPSAFTDAGVAIKVVSIRHVRSVAQPMADSSRDKRVALSKLPLSTIKAFAVSQSIQMFAAMLHQADSKVPAYVEDFDHIVLTGSGDRKSSFSVQLSTRNPDTGDVVMGPSVSYGPK